MGFNICLWFAATTGCAASLLKGYRATAAFQPAQHAARTCTGPARLQLNPDRVEQSERAGRRGRDSPLRFPVHYSHYSRTYSRPQLLHASSGVAGLQCCPEKVEWRIVRAAGAESALKGNILSVDALVTAMEELQHDISPGDTPGAPQAGSALSCTLIDIF